MELKKTLVSVMVFRRDDIMGMCPSADEGNDSVGWGLAQPRRWPLESMCRREQVLEVGGSWAVGS